MEIIQYILFAVVFTYLILLNRRIKSLIKKDMRAVNPNVKRQRIFYVIGFSYFIVLISLLVSDTMDVLMISIVNTVLFVLVFRSIVFYNKSEIVYKAKTYLKDRDFVKLVHSELKYKKFQLGEDQLIVYKKHDQLMNLLNEMNSE